MVVAVALTGVVLGPGTGWSYWTAQAFGWGSASTGTLTAAVVTVESVTWPGSVELSWTAGATSAGGAPAGGYYVTRIEDGAEAEAAACGTTPQGTTMTLTCTDPSVPFGQYRYRVTAVHHGWTAVSVETGAVTVADDLTSPTISVTNVTPTASGAGWHDSDPVTVELTAADTGGSGLASITYWVDGRSPTTVTTSTASVEVPGDGTHILYYRAVDNAGNASAPEGEPQFFLVWIDSIAPAAPSPPDLADASDSYSPLHPGSSNTDDLTNDDTPTFSGTAEPDSRVTLHRDGIEVGRGVVAPDGTYLVVTEELAEGAGTITARATDPAGNTSATSDVLVVTIDTVAPTVPSVPDLDGDNDSFSVAYAGMGISTNTDDDTPTFTGFTDASSAVTLFDADAGLAGATAVGTTYRITVPDPGLADDDYDLTAMATDLAGNPSAPTDTSLAVTIDTVAPAVTIDTADASVRRYLLTDYYSAVFGGVAGVAPGDGDLLVQLCTSGDCTLVPGSPTVVDSPSATWSRSSDEVYDCTLSVLGGNLLCGGTSPVFARAMQIDRAGNSAPISRSVGFE